MTTIPHMFALGGLVAGAVLAPRGSRLAGAALGGLAGVGVDYFAQGGRSASGAVGYAGGLFGDGPDTQDSAAEKAAKKALLDAGFDPLVGGA